MFAALYALLGLIPISKLVGISSFITFRELVSPLVGMLLGPLGSLSIIVGVFVDFGLGRPVVFLGLDFLIDLAAVVTAGLAFSGMRKLAVAFPSALIAVFLLSPSAAYFVKVGGAQVPFVWMHVLSVIIMAIALYFESIGLVKRVSVFFVGAVFFGATMAGHIMGGILTEYVYLGQGVLFGASSVAAYWSVVFYLYPVERLILTVLGTAVAVPVLRALSRKPRQDQEGKPAPGPPR